MSIPLLVVLGVRRGGQKVLLAVKNMGGETEAAWRHALKELHDKVKADFTDMMYAGMPRGC
jgi:hypothetical protein